MVKGDDGADGLMQSQRGLLLAVLDEVYAAVQTATNEDVAHWHRHSAWISAMVLSVASWRKKKRRCGSDKSAHDLGSDKSKNASILRKYGSICMGEKTNCLFGFCTNMILSKISPAETFTRT